MPVFALDEELIFPHPILREPDGLLAVGGDLSTEKLLLAYRWEYFHGIMTNNLFFGGGLCPG